MGKNEKIEDSFEMNVKINLNNCQPEFYKIIELFIQDCNGKLFECYYSAFNRLIIKGYNNEYCILTLGYNGENRELVIEEIQFINRRKGNMTKLYNILKGLQYEYKTGKIRIESVLSNKMENWCIKNGFNYYNGSYYQPDVE